MRDRSSARAPARLRPGVRRGAFGLVLAGSLGISTSYGILVLLPLRVRELGGDEADFGLVMASAAIPAAICIGLLVRFPDRIAPEVLLAAAIALYGVTAAAVSLVSSLALLTVLGLTLGTAWAIVYTTTPMVVTKLVPDARRTVAFGFATGAQQLGIGLGPVLGLALRDSGLSLASVFVVAGVVAGVAALSVLSLTTRVSASPATGATAATDTPLGLAMRRIARSPAARPLLLVLLSACLFTTLTFFQTTYAAARGLNSDVFFLAYTGAVLLARFVISRRVTHVSPSRVAAVSTTILCGSICSLLFVGSSVVVYAIAATGIGIGYGLALPTLQSLAVAFSREDVRSRVLPVAGLVFQTAILAFPALAGTVISRQGYQAVFAVLLALALAQTLVAWGLPTRTGGGPASDTDDRPAPWRRLARARPGAREARPAPAGGSGSAAPTATPVESVAWTRSPPVGLVRRDGHSRTRRLP